MVRSFSFLSPDCFFFLVSSSVFFSFFLLLVVISTPLPMQRPTGERSKTGKASAGPARGLQA